MHGDADYTLLCSTLPRMHRQGRGACAKGRRRTEVSSRGVGEVQAVNGAKIPVAQF